jgi:hypothetical protein
MNIDTLVIKKFKVFDLLGSEDFSLSGGTWSLYKRSTGAVIANGSYTANNSDTDRAGNTIKTVSMTIDLRNTDEFDRGSYYLLIETQLATQQTDMFRFPVELVDYRRKGVA